MPKRPTPATPPAQVHRRRTRRSRKREAALTLDETNALTEEGFRLALAEEEDDAPGSGARAVGSRADYHPGAEPPRGRRGELTLAGEKFSVLAPPDFTYFDVEKRAEIDHEGRKRYLISLARYGREMLACHAAGSHRYEIKKELARDPEFARMREEAWAIYCDRIVAATGRLAFEGTWEPVIGRQGKDNDAVIGWKRRIEYRALEAEQRRCVPEYRQHAVLDVNARVGVLVVRQPLSVEAWQAKHGGDDKMTKDPLEGIPGAHAALAATRLDPNGLALDEQAPGEEE